MAGIVNAKCVQYFMSNLILLGGISNPYFKLILCNIRLWKKKKSDNLN